MQEPLKALTQSYTRTKAKNYDDVPRDDGAAHQLVEQHALRRRRRQHRLLPRATSFRSATRSSTGRKPVDGSDPATEWKGVLSVDETPEPAQPGERLGLQHEQLAVVGGRAEQPEAGGLSRRTSRRGGENRARRPRDARAAGQEGLHARLADRRGVRQLPAGVRDADPAAGQGVRRSAGRRPAQGEAGRADRAAARLGLPLVGARRCRRRSRCSGARSSGGASAPTRARRACRPTTTSRRRRRREQLLQALAAASDKLTADFGKWKTPWGDINRFQRLTGDIVQPFNDAAPSIPVGFTSARWGSLASFGARAYHGHEEDVRHERQQLRGGGRVRRPRAREGGHGRRRERRSGVAALQRRALVDLADLRVAVELLDRVVLDEAVAAEQVHRERRRRARRPRTRRACTSPPR